VALVSDDISRLYARHAEELLGYFARRTLQPEVAVDLVGETFACAFADRAQFRGAEDGEAIAWVFGIARHQLAEYFRRGHVERRALARLGVAVAPLVDADYERVEELATLADLRVRVAECIADLSADHSEALRLRIVEERSYAEVALTLGVSEQTARARVSRALRALRDTTALEPEERADHV
jgi:RNA polymerase sigma factor (sigma-70 family)